MPIDEVPGRRHLHDRRQSDDVLDARPCSTQHARAVPASAGATSLTSRRRCDHHARDHRGVRPGLDLLRRRRRRSSWPISPAPTSTRPRRSAASTAAPRSRAAPSSVSPTSTTSGPCATMSASSRSSPALSIASAVLSLVLVALAPLHAPPDGRRSEIRLPSWPSRSLRGVRPAACGCRASPSRCGPLPSPPCRGGAGPGHGSAVARLAGRRPAGARALGRRAVAAAGAVAAVGVACVAVGMVVRDTLASQLSGVRRPQASRRWAVVARWRWSRWRSPCWSPSSRPAPRATRTPPTSSCPCCSRSSPASPPPGPRPGWRRGGRAAHQHSRSLGSFVSARAISRRQEGTLVILPVTAAIAVAVFGAGVYDSAATWRASVAATASPGEVTWTSPLSLRDTRDLTRASTRRRVGDDSAPRSRTRAPTSPSSTPTGSPPSPCGRRPGRPGERGGGRREHRDRGRRAVPGRPAPLDHHRQPGTDLATPRGRGAPGLGRRHARTGLRRTLPPRRAHALGPAAADVRHRLPARGPHPRRRRRHDDGDGRHRAGARDRRRRRARRRRHRRRRLGPGAGLPGPQHDRRPGRGRWLHRPRPGLGRQRRDGPPHLRGHHARAPGRPGGRRPPRGHRRPRRVGRDPGAAGGHRRGPALRRSQGAAGGLRLLHHRPARLRQPLRDPGAHALRRAGRRAHRPRGVRADRGDDPGRRAAGAGPERLRAGAAPLRRRRRPGAAHGAGRALRLDRRPARPPAGATPPRCAWSACPGGR